MKNFKKFTASALALILSFSLVACNNDNGDTDTDEEGTTKEQVEGEDQEEEEPSEDDTEEEEPRDVELLIWTPSEDQAESDGAWIYEQTDLFAKEHPEYNITWNFDVGGSAGAKEDVLKDVTAAADVYEYPNDQVTQLVQGGGLSEIGGDYKDWVYDNMAEIYPESVTIGDSLYGFPFASNTWFMYYNTDTYTEEDVKSLETMLEKGTVAFPLKDSWYTASFFVANGGTLFGEDGKDEEAGIDFGGEKGLQATHYLIDLVANDNFVVDEDNLGLTGLADGSVDAIFSGSWDAKAVKDALGDKMGAAQLPTIQIDGEEKQLRSFAGSKAYGVNPTSENIDVATEFAKFLADAPARVSHYEKRGIVPAHSEAADTPELKDDVVVQAEQNTMANTSILQPTVDSMNLYWDPTVNFATALANGEITHDNAEEYLESYNEQMNQSVLD